MCLAIPGKIIGIRDTDQPEDRAAQVSFGGIVKQVSLAFTPEARIHDYVLVHVGFALNVIDDEEAAKVFEFLNHMGETEDAPPSPALP